MSDSVLSSKSGTVFNITDDFKYADIEGRRRSSGRTIGNRNQRIHSDSAAGSEQTTKVDPVYSVVDKRKCRSRSTDGKGRNARSTGAGGATDLRPFGSVENVYSLARL